MLSAITVTQASYFFVLYLYGQLFAKYVAGQLFNISQAIYSPVCNLYSQWHKPVIDHVTAASHLPYNKPVIYLYLIPMTGDTGQLLTIQRQITVIIEIMILNVYCI